jgi:DNA-directed RNA polymerase subunit RPC12/RpoP
LNPNCPDCKGQVELQKIDTYTTGYDGGCVRNDEPYYKCPKCGTEFNSEDLDG